MNKYFNSKTASILLILITTIVSFIIKNQILLFLLIAIISILLIFLLVKKNKNKMLLSEIKLEIKNIQWPNKKEVNQSMLMVSIIIACSSVIIWLIDSILTFLISKII
jgi:preprotein translocase subunit SecE